MGRYTEITLDEVVASAKMALQIRTTDSDIFLMDMCNEGVGELKTPSIYKKQICVLEIEDMKAKLPCGFVKLLGLRWGNGNACSDIIYVDLPYLKACDCTVTNSVADWTGAFEIQHGYIYFHNLPTDATTVTIGYMGLNVDEKGRAIIYENYRRALRAYTCWRYCLQNSDDALYRSQKMDYYMEWVAQKKGIRSEDVANDFHNQKHQIQSIMNSWIADKRNWATL